MIATMKLDAEQEAKLVQRCLRREQEAWDELVSTYAPGIQYRIKCITKPNDLKIKSSGQGAKIPQSDLADEICQEVFVKLIKKDFKNLRSYNPAKGKLSTWLTKITINTAKDYWRNPDVFRSLQIPVFIKKTKIVLPKSLLTLIS